MTFGQELVSLHTTPSVFGKFAVHDRGSVDIWTNNILYRFIEGQTHIGMPRGANMDLALNVPKEVALSADSDTTSSMHHKVERNNWYCIQSNQWKIIGDQLPIESSIWL